MKKRWHIVFSFFLLISFSWQCAARSVIFLSFTLNQKELTATVCENKNKPKNCCQAKCFLDKEIKKEEKRQSDSSSNIKDKTEKTELRTSLLKFLFNNNEIVTEHIFLYSAILPKIISTSVFHPPTV